MRNVKSGSDWPCWLRPSLWVRSVLRFPWWRTLSGLSACSVWQTNSLWIESLFSKKTAEICSRPIATYQTSQMISYFMNSVFPHFVPLSLVQQDTSHCQTSGPWIGNILLSPNHGNNPYIVDGCLSDIFCVVGKIQNSSGISQWVLTSRENVHCVPRIRDWITDKTSQVPHNVICFFLNKS